MKDRDGGPAFPLCTYDDGEIFGTQHGMSLRDWFAGRSDIPWDVAVLVTEIATGKDSPSHREVLETRALLRYADADAMLAARDAEEGQTDGD